MHDFAMSGIPELPERISVETRFVSREIAKAQNLNCVDLETNRNTHFVSVSPRMTATITPFTVVKPTANAEVMTDNPNPMRDREIQTLIPTTTIAIQCDLNQDEKEIEFQKFFEPAAAEKTDPGQHPDNEEAIQKINFDHFIKSKTHTFVNGKRECLICGEMKKDGKKMESHMALHWGPQKLCFRCGICFEHKMIWQKHNCGMRGASNKPKYIKCPYHLCAAVVISPLELYDHLNEHCGIRFHKCTTCGKKYATSGELRRHLKIKKKCNANLENMKPNEKYGIPAEDGLYRQRVHVKRDKSGKRFIVKRYLSEMASKSGCNGSHFCSICLRRCKSLNVYQLHIKRCLAIYRRRLRCAQIKAAVSWVFDNGLTNGHK